MALLVLELNNADFNPTREAESFQNASLQGGVPAEHNPTLQQAFANIRAPVSALRMQSKGRTQSKAAHGAAPHA